MSLAKLTAASKSFGGLTVLEDLNLTFDTGELVVVLGTNCAGKSTLIRILAGVEMVCSLVIGSFPVGRVWVVSGSPSVIP